MKYEEPNMSLILFPEIADVITASVGDVDPGNNGDEWWGNKN